jgi:hypothetical protein
MSATATATATVDRFQHEIRTLMKERIGVAAWVGAFVFPWYFFEDQALCPDDWQRVYALRLICTMTCILAAALNHTKLARNHTFVFVIMVTAAVSVLKSFTTALVVDDIQALYFGGHVLILCGILAFLPLNWWQALLTGGTVLLGYAAPTLLFADPVEHVPFQIQVGLMTAVWLQLTFGCHLNYNVRQREFEFRNKLHQVRVRADDYGF